MVKLNCSKIVKFVFISLITPLFVVAYFSSQKAQAQMPSTINFQGKIVRNDSGYEGMNVTTGSPACVQAGADTCDFQVKYYSASSGGTLFLTETFVDKEIGQYGGVFELSLGSGSITAGSHSTLDEVIQKENTIYIEIGFSPAGNSTFTETFTRMYLQANAFAIRSKYSEMAKGAFKFENAPNSSGYSGSDGMVYYDTTTGGLKLYSAGVWLDISTGTSSSLWGTDSISSYSHSPSQFLETSGIATLSNFGLDTTVNRAWIHGASSRTGFSVYSNYGGATDWPLVTFKADASNFGNSILQLIQDGTGSILEGYKGTNKVFDIDNRGDMHLSSDGILYFEPFSSLPSSGNLFPGSGEGCLYSAGGNIYWDSGCDASAPTMLNAASSSLWTDAGSFTYLTSTGDNLVLGGNSVATATFFFDMTGASGRYFRVDNYNNTETLFTIDSSGNVGIGTATPGAKLDIGGSSANISNAIGDITIIPAQNLIISQGNVGIGNSSPTSLLSVGSTSQFQVDSNGDLVKIKNLTYSWPTAHTTSGLLSNNGTGTLTWNTAADLGLSSGTGVAGQITFWNGTSTIAGDNNLWWDNVNKRLGIGTTTPQATIDIAGASSEIANTSGSIIIAPAENLIVSQGKFAVGTFGTGNTAPASKFHMRWANSGAGGGMDVGGQLMNDAAIFENSGNTHLQLMTGGSGFFSSINFSIPTNAAHGSIKYNYTAGPGGVANGFGFWTNGNVFRMALDQNGNLGVGTNEPSQKLDVIGNIKGQAFVGAQTTGVTLLASGTSTATGTWIEMYGTGHASRAGELGIGSNGASGIIRFWNYTSSYTELMRIAANGNVGIGTNNPLQKLHIAGSIRGGSTAGALQIITDHGYLLMGPKNTSYAHIETDIDRFYFNKPLFVGTGTISSYNANLLLQTMGTTRMSISNSNGYITMGTGLTIFSGGRDTNVTTSVIRTTGNLILSAATTGAVYLNYDSGSGGVILNNGSTGLYGITTSTTTGFQAMYINTSSGQLARYTSSIKYKEDVQGLSPDLAKYLQLNPVSFIDKTNGTRGIGLIAEEVASLVPDLAVYDDQGNPDGVSYQLLGLYNMLLLKQLKKDVDLLSSTISTGLEVELEANQRFGILSSPGWYRVSQGSSSESGNVKISNNTLGSSQNINLMVDRNNISVLSNFTSGNYGITKARLNTSGNMTYLEVYIENTNNNSVSVKVEGWSSTGISKVDTLSTAKEYILSGIQFGVSDTFSVNKENLTTSGTLLTSGMYSNIGESSNRWNDIYTKGTIRLGSGSSEGGIRYNVEKKRLEFSNDGTNWIEMGDSTSNIVISPEYSGAILYADGSDNHGRMTSDAINTGGVFKNYYEWKSDRETLQDYDILVRITLPSDFVSWKEDAISLDFMTENSASIANNKVEIALIGDSGIDSEIKNGISKMPGSWERISIKAVDITQCKKAGDSCTLRLSMYSKENYYVRVGDISLNYNRGL